MQLDERALGWDRKNRGPHNKEPILKVSDLENMKKKNPM